MTVTLAGVYLALLALHGPAPAPDTTVAVQPGDVLVAETPAGVLTVRVWERNEVRLEGSSRGIRRDGATLRLVESLERSRRRETTALTVPRWMDVRIMGETLDVDVAGLEGRLSVMTLAGDVTLAETGGEVRARSLAGQVTARRVRGRADLSAVEGDVVVTGGEGALTVSSTDGTLILRDMAVRSLTAETTDGDIHFQGRIVPGSRIRLATHDGDIDVAVPEDTAAEVSVSTFDGAFHPAFPVETRGLRAGEALRFVLGRGGASLDIWAFDGDIRLRHGGL